MKQILIAIDFSQYEKRAYDRAVLLAAEHRAALEVLHVITSAYAAEGAKTMQTVEHLLRGADVSSRSEVRVGHAAETIARYAQDESADGIIMGTRGMGSVKGWVLGSVATGVVHLASVPVTPSQVSAIALV